MTTPCDSVVSAIVPAFNERGRLRHVLEVLQKVPDLADIIVVDDGSTDGTELEVLDQASSEPRLRCIRLPENRGKARALQAGVDAARGDLVVFVDADLNHLTPELMQALIQPVRAGQADMTVGVFRQGKWYTDLSQRITPWMSGQRCLPRALFYQVPLDQVVGYGIETALTVIAHQQHWRVQLVPLLGVSHNPLQVRRGIKAGSHQKGLMYVQVIKTYLALRRNDDRPRFPRVMRMLLIAGQVLFGMGTVAGLY